MREVERAGIVTSDSSRFLVNGSEWNGGFERQRQAIVAGSPEKFAVGRLVASQRVKIYA
jgi:hypothetical protein